MQTTDDAREHCRFVGKGIEKMVADGGDFSYFGNEVMKVIRVPETKNRIK